MRVISFSTALALATPALSASIESNTVKDQNGFAADLMAYTKGFRNPRIDSSAGGHAICISGTIDVKASAKNLHLNIEAAANSSAVTQLVLETFQINSTVGEQYVGSPTQVSGTYGIYSQLCFPKGSRPDARTIQFLTHGIGCDKAYWDIAPDYSYVDYAAEQGYTTFLYDRLGTGLSDHPDPVQIVQLPLQVEIAHGLIHLLRTGSIAGHAYKHVIGVGHSYGSIQTQMVTSRHPADLDAAVLTGFTTSKTRIPITFSSQALSIASEAAPLRFAHLSNGYLSSSARAGVQMLFFRAPHFDPALLDLAELTKQTLTIGELFTSGSFPVAKDFKGPVYVVNGEHDLPDCQGNCFVPHNLSKAVKDELFPAASKGSGWYVAPGDGHAVNYHYGAQTTYKQIHGFLKKNGF